MPAPSVSRSIAFSGRPVALAMMLVVASFAVALFVSHYRANAIEARAADIAANALPSIEHLGTARSELRRVAMYVNEYVADSARDHPNSRVEIDMARRRLVEEIVAYRALPTFPGELEFADRVTASLRFFDAALRKTLDARDAQQFDAAVAALHESFRGALEDLDRSIFEVIKLNVVNGGEAARRIAQLKRRAEEIAIVLGGFSLIGAAVASVVAYRAIYNYARLIEAHNQVLEWRANELEAFAGRVAHDLKQPLGAVALRMITIQRKPERESFDKMIEQLKRMDRIIDGLLEFARSGAKPQSGQRSNLLEVIQDVISDVKPSSDEVGAELRVEPTAPFFVACAPGALTSVLSNVVRNAVKYIVEGNQSVRRITVRVAERGEMVRVVVDDTGPGLPLGTERIIFEPHVRLPGSKQPGVGLGLATVKRIVEAYGGQVGVNSTAGQGSSFWFELPRAS